jgi:hypothetical protein
VLYGIEIQAKHTSQLIPSGPAALRGLILINDLFKLAKEEESPQSLIAGRVSATVLSSSE